MTHILHLISSAPMKPPFPCHVSLYRRQAWADDDDDTPCSHSESRSLDTCRHDLRRTWIKPKLWSKSAGALELLTSMPLDILYEIFRYLHPMDVLNLSRTSRQLRAMLLSRSAVTTWRTALASLKGLPPCPSDLNEPQYTRLLFENRCYSCLKAHVENVYWTCRVRCCKACFNKSFITVAALRRIIPDCLGLQSAEAIFPFIVDSVGNQREHVLFYAPSAQQLTCQIFDLVRFGDRAALAAWTKAKKQEQVERLSHAALCEAWAVRWVRRPADDMNAVIVVVLLFLLAVLWKDKLWNIWGATNIYLYARTM